MSTDPVGSLAEEAAKLIASVQLWTRNLQPEPDNEARADATAEVDDVWAAAEHVEHAEHAAEHAEHPPSLECRFCPVCSTGRLTRALSPEVRAHVASAALSMVFAVKELISALGDSVVGGR
ncbi:MAG: hypothetical protein WKF82_12085 [Nocardioidaceae bacterium]